MNPDNKIKYSEQKVFELGILNDNEYMLSKSEL